METSKDILLDPRTFGVRIETDRFILDRVAYCAPIKKAFTGFFEAYPSKEEDYESKLETFDAFMRGLQDKLGYKVRYGYSGMMEEPYWDSIPRGSLTVPFQFLSIRVGDLRLVAILYKGWITIHRCTDYHSLNDYNHFSVYREDSLAFRKDSWSSAPGIVQDHAVWSAWNNPVSLASGDPIPTDSRHVYWVTGIWKSSTKVFFEGQKLNILSGARPVGVPHG